MMWVVIMEKGLTELHIIDKCFATVIFSARYRNPMHGDVGCCWSRDFVTIRKFLLSLYPVPEYLKIGDIT